MTAASDTEFETWNRQAIKDFGLRIDVIPEERDEGTLLSPGDRYRTLENLLDALPDMNLEMAYSVLADYPLLWNLFTRVGMKNYRLRMSTFDLLSPDTMRFIVQYSNQTYQDILRALDGETTEVQKEIRDEFYM